MVRTVWEKDKVGHLSFNLCIWSPPGLSSDSAPTNYYLFPMMKKDSDDDVITAADFWQRIRTLHDPNTKWANVKEGYVENDYTCIFKTASFFLRPWTYQSVLCFPHRIFQYCSDSTNEAYLKAEMFTFNKGYLILFLVPLNMSKFIRICQWSALTWWHDESYRFCKSGLHVSRAPG